MERCAYKRVKRCLLASLPLGSLLLGGSLLGGSLLSSFPMLGMNSPKWAGACNAGAIAGF